MTSLIPYVRQLEINMTFKDIAANALIYSYGRTTIQPLAGNTRKCELTDVGIVSAELVLFWVKPRDEKIMNIPRTVRIQSWLYDHKQFPLPNVGTGEAFVSNTSSAINSQRNIYTNQQPSYLLYYGMVDKDSDNYKCRAVNSDFDGAGGHQNINITQNSVEAGMHPIRPGAGDGLRIRSNTLGGDDILDFNYSIKELYRLTLKNSVKDFPYGETKFRGLSAAESMLSSYPSEFYLLLG